MNKKIFLYLALMTLGLYVMPNTVALFVGQHTFFSGMGSCEQCHSDVLSQLMAGASYEKHRTAAANTNYTTYLSLGGKSFSNGAITDYNNYIWSWNSSARKWQNQSNPSELKNTSLDRDNDSVINEGEVCLLCHDSILSGIPSHVAVVRVCDDDRCHGNRNNSFNSPELLGTTSRVTKAGNYLSKANAHQPFYLEASNQTSSYGAVQFYGQVPGNTYGSFISRGHWTCEGCHTDVVGNATIYQAPAYNHSVSTPSEPKRYN